MLGLAGRGRGRSRNYRSVRMYADIFNCTCCRYMYLVVDSVVEARDAEEDGGLQLRHVLQQLQHVAAVEADGGAAVDGRHGHGALVDVRQRQVADVPVPCRCGCIQIMSQGCRTSSILQ